MEEVFVFEAKEVSLQLWYTAVWLLPECPDSLCPMVSHRSCTKEQQSGEILVQLLRVVRTLPVFMQQQRV